MAKDQALIPYEAMFLLPPAAAMDLQVAPQVMDERLA